MKFKLLALAASLFAAVQSQGALVLTINIANPSAVVITGVANNSQITANLAVDFSGGISILNFFTQNESMLAGTPITGNWTPRGTATTFNEMVTFAFGSPDVVPGVDLSIYHNALNASDLQQLVTTAAPFSGSATVNLAAFTHLPAVGTTGNVNLGYLSTQGGVIGQWQVIPEPSAAIIGALGLLGLLRRRR